MTQINIINETIKWRSLNLDTVDFYVGRSSTNDVQVKDRFVSRRHLKVTKREAQYCIKDLNSKNGTFVSGKQIMPSVEFEIKEGEPIVMGMSAISLGKDVPKDILPYLNPAILKKKLDQSGMRHQKVKYRSLNKNMDLICTVSEILLNSLSLKEAFQNVMDSLFGYLKRIDRGALILINNDKEEISEAYSRFKNGSHDDSPWYNQKIVDYVIRDETPIVFSNILEEENEDHLATFDLMKDGSLICIPLRGKKRILGVFYLDSIEKRNGFREDDLSLLTSLSNSMATAIEKKYIH